MPPRLTKPNDSQESSMIPYPYPDDGCRDRAERASHDLFVRYQTAMVRLNRCNADSSTGEVASALRAVADLSAEVSRLIAIGWHHDQPF